MSCKPGPRTVNESESVYRNPFIEVVDDRVIRPDGRPGTYGTVSMREGIAVLPVDDNGVAPLTREFRYAIGRESLEVAGGGIDEDESPLDAARREAREELGVEASEWVDLGVIDPFTAVVRSPAHLFLARGLRFTEPNHEGDGVHRGRQGAVRGGGQAHDGRGGSRTGQAAS